MSFPTSSAICILHLARFGWFIMEHIREIFPPGVPVAIWKQPRLRFGGAFSAVCGGGGVEQPRPSRRRGDGGKAWGCFMFFPHIFVKLLTEVSTVDFLFRGTPVGLLEIGGSPEPQWPNGKTTWASSLFFTEVVLELSVMSFLCRLCHWETAALVHWSHQQTTSQDIEPSGAAYLRMAMMSTAKRSNKKLRFRSNTFSLTAPGWGFWTEVVFWNVIIGKNCLNMVIDESLAFIRAASSKDSDRSAVLIHSNSLLGPGSKGKNEDHSTSRSRYECINLTCWIHW